MRNTNSTPTAMPMAHMTAMAESSRTSRRRDIHSTATDEPTANTAAMATGFTPKK